VIRVSVAATVAVVALAFPGAAAAADTYVDDDGTGTAPCAQSDPCPTIAAGIAAAGPGDTVNVGQGNYQETVTLDDGKSLDGEGGNTVIDASANAEGAVSVTIPIGDAGTISGIRFTDDGTGEQYAILADGSSPTISQNDFVGFYRAVNIHDATADATIVNNDFSGSHHIATGNGAEVDVEFGATATITSNSFHDPGGTATGVLVGTGGATLERNIISDYLVSISNSQLPVSLNGDLLTGSNDLFALTSRDDGADDPDVGDVSLTNVTFWNNGGADLGGIAVDFAIDSTIVQDPINTFSAFGTTTCAITHSRGPTTSGTSCETFQTSADPLFEDAANGNYRLSAASTLIDAGNPGATPGLTDDLNGDPRVLDGPDGGTCLGADAVRDIGADEHDCRPEIERGLTIAYAARADALKGKLTATDAPACRATQPIETYREKPGIDPKVGPGTTTNQRGKYKVAAPKRRGRYYALAPETVEPEAGICVEAESPPVRVR
jgi:hypothetical protein